MQTNLPKKTSTDSATNTTNFFNSYYDTPMSLSSEDVNAAIGFFQSRGFEYSAASSVAGTLISQSKIENVKVFQIIETLKGLTDLQLSTVVNEILNYNRIKISTLGYRVTDSTKNQFEARNVIK